MDVLGVNFMLTPFYCIKYATFFEYLRYMGMIKEMINNMLGEYSKFIQIQDDGIIKVFVPEDVNNPSMENATELTLSKNEVISLMGLVTQPKQYEVCDSSNNCRIISEKDPDFDVNKWIKLALGTIKK